MDKTAIGSLLFLSVIVSGVFALYNPLVAPLWLALNVFGLFMGLVVWPHKEEVA